MTGTYMGWSHEQWAEAFRQSGQVMSVDVWVRAIAHYEDSPFSAVQATWWGRNAFAPLEIQSSGVWS